MNTFKPSRRIALRKVLFAAGATLTASVIPLHEARAQKISKADMKYQDTPKGDEKCSNCQYIVGTNACGIVEGSISPNGWCVAWKKTGS